MVSKLVIFTWQLNNYQNNKQSWYCMSYHISLCFGLMVFNTSPHTKTTSLTGYTGSDVPGCVVSTSEPKWRPAGRWRRCEWTTTEPQHGSVRVDSRSLPLAVPCSSAWVQWLNTNSADGDVYSAAPQINYWYQPLNNHYNSRMSGGNILFNKQYVV